jgi:cardiolipin synthase
MLLLADAVSGRESDLWHAREECSLTAHLALAIIVLLLALDILLLVLVVVSRRSTWRKAPSHRFPHLDLDAVTVGANRLTIYTYGKALYAAMLAAIDVAQDSIYLETYIWKGDAVGEEFKQHLARKAAAGAAVYATFDTVGNLNVPHRFKHFPAPIHTLHFRALRRPWQVFDPRRYALDHRKLLVVDGSVGFLGGYNLGSLYATQWRDTHVSVRGPAAGLLAQAFVDFWNRHTPARRHIARQYPHPVEPHLVVRTTDAQRGSFPIHRMYIAAIDRAQQSIALTNAYFVPDHSLLDALKAAAQRGVDVEVLVPWTSNHRLVDWVARGYFNDCLAAGILVFCYQGAMIHAKTCTIDGHWSTVGTANLDRLSSLGNYEINLEIESPDVAQHLQAIFTSDTTHATELTLHQWTARPWYAKVSERLLAPLRGMV